MLDADPAVLTDTPFRDWRLPGVLLATLVGSGYLITACWQWRGGAGAGGLSAAAGLGLVLFEGVELAWLGFQPLEAVMAGVGLLVAALASRAPQHPAVPCRPAVTRVPRTGPP